MQSRSKHDTVAERLRRLTRNQLGLSRVGSSPAGVVFFLFLSLYPVSSLGLSLYPVRHQPSCFVSIPFLVFLSRCINSQIRNRRLTNSPAGVGSFLICLSILSLLTVALLFCLHTFSSFLIQMYQLQSMLLVELDRNCVVCDVRTSRNSKNNGSDCQESYVVDAECQLDVQQDSQLFSLPQSSVATAAYLYVLRII